MNDQAAYAGIGSNLNVTNKYIRLNYSCYSDKITKYLEYIAKNWHNGIMTEAFFKDVVNKKIRT